MRALRIIQDYVRARKALEKAKTELFDAQIALQNLLHDQGPLRDDEQVYALDHDGDIIVSEAPKDAWGLEIPDVQPEDSVEPPVQPPVPCGGVVGSEVPDHPF